MLTESIVETLLQEMLDEYDDNKKEMERITLDDDLEDAEELLHEEIVTKFTELLMKGMKGGGEI